MIERTKQPDDVYGGFSEELVNRGAEALNNARGFGFCTTPEEGQDLYDISQESINEVVIVLKAIFPKGPPE